MTCITFDNPKVQQELLDILKFWLDIGIDGFRVDAVPYLCTVVYLCIAVWYLCIAVFVYCYICVLLFLCIAIFSPINDLCTYYAVEREGTSCENLPETHAFLRVMRKFIDDNYPGMGENATLHVIL